MFDTTMATQELLIVVLYFGGVVTGIISAILGLVVALVGLGWGIRKFLRWITGSSSGGLTYEMIADHDMRNRTWRVGGNEM